MADFEVSDLEVPLFERFLTTLFIERGGLDPKDKEDRKTLGEFTSPQGMLKFVEAFTHPSYHLESRKDEDGKGEEEHEPDYRTFSFFGNGVTNEVVAQYLKRNIPEVNTVVCFTRIKHTLMHQDILAKLADEAGFTEWIRCGEEWLGGVLEKCGGHRARHNSKEYRKMVQHVFEAFIGCMVEISNKTSPAGIGHQLATNMISSFLDKVDIPTRYEHVVDTKTQLKELCDRRGWAFQITTKEVCVPAQTEEKGKEEEEKRMGYRAEVTLPPPLKKKVTAVARTKSDAQQEAAKKSLRILKIVKKEDFVPYEFTTKKMAGVDTRGVDWEGFKKFLENMFKEGKLNRRQIETLTTRDSMGKFLIAFTHSSYNDERYGVGAGRSYPDYELYEFFGDTIVNNVVGWHVGERFPDIRNVRWLNRIKHRLISKATLATLADEAGFARWIRWGKVWMDRVVKSCGGTERVAESTEYMSVLEDVFEAFIGCLDEILSAEAAGLGRKAVMRMMRGFLYRVPISTKWEDLVDPVTQLKELFDQQGWYFSSKRVIRTRQVRSGEFVATIFKVEEEKGHECLCSAKGTTEKKAKNNAALRALGVLKERGIFTVPPTIA